MTALRARLANMVRESERVLPVLAATYGASEARRWWVYWLVSHYLFGRP